MLTLYVQKVNPVNIDGTEVKLQMVGPIFLLFLCSRFFNFPSCFFSGIRQAKNDSERCLYLSEQCKLFLTCLSLSSTSSYYRGAQGIIIVYDITQQKSFDGLNKWLKEIKIFADADACKLLVGNKTDLSERVISTEQGQV